MKKVIQDSATQQRASESYEIAVAPGTLIQKAIESGANVEVLEKLLALQERWDASQAKKAFDAAMADIRRELPDIIKTRKVDFTSQKGRTHYRYEDLAEIVDTLSPVMAEHGLSFRWRTESQNAESVKVTCIISHRDGHYEETALTAAHDHSGNKNDIQAIGSAVTYLQRYTLKAAIGVAASEDDDSLSSQNEPPMPQRLSDDSRTHQHSFKGNPLKCTICDLLATELKKRDEPARRLSGETITHPGSGGASAVTSYTNEEEEAKPKDKKPKTKAEEEEEFAQQQLSRLDTFVVDTSDEEFLKATTVDVSAMCKGLGKHADELETLLRQIRERKQKLTAKDAR